MKYDYEEKANFSHHYMKNKHLWFQKIYLSFLSNKAKK